MGRTVSWGPLKWESGWQWLMGWASEWGWVVVPEVSSELRVRCEEDLKMGVFPSFPPSVPSLNNFNWVPTTCQRFVTYCCVTDGWARTPAFCSRSSQGCPGGASVLGEGIDRGAWEAAVHGVPENPTRLSTHTHAGHETYLLFSDHVGWFMGDCVHKSPALPHTSLFLGFGLLHRRLLVFPNSAGTSFHWDDLLTGDIVHSTPCFCCCLLCLDGEGLQSLAMPFSWNIFHSICGILFSKDIIIIAFILN